MKVFVIQNEDKEIIAVATDINRGEFIAKKLSSDNYKTTLCEFDTEDYDHIQNEVSSWFVCFNEEGKVTKAMMLQRLCNDFYSEANRAVEIFVKTDKGREEAIQMATQRRQERLLKRQN